MMEIYDPELEEALSRVTAQLNFSDFPEAGQMLQQAFCFFAINCHLQYLPRYYCSESFLPFACRDVHGDGSYEGVTRKLSTFHFLSESWIAQSEETINSWSSHWAETESDGDFSSLDDCKVADMIESSIQTSATVGIWNHKTLHPRFVFQNRHDSNLWLIINPSSERETLPIWLTSPSQVINP